MQKQEKYIQKLSDKGGNVEDQEAENKDKVAIFKGPLGELMSEKKIARYVQKHIVKHNVVTTDEIFNYNTMMIELSNIKK